MKKYDQRIVICYIKRIQKGRFKRTVQWFKDLEVMEQYAKEEWNEEMNEYSVIWNRQIKQSTLLGEDKCTEFETGKDVEEIGLEDENLQLQGKGECKRLNTNRVRMIPNYGYFNQWRSRMQDARSTVRSGFIGIMQWNVQHHGIKIKPSEQQCWRKWMGRNVKLKRRKKGGIQQTRESR
ncbi:unnamed protein product [Paramecium sonneborni]|uniref:Uncharacterized protein n=1 Tax=Paramecium sonneborni TaxID=65129 RepID=A0A8S1LEP4_9CILI|nr:unnamed protein product [Paramecium sonneborni]